MKIIFETWKEQIAWFIAFSLPWQVVLFAYVRACAWASTHEFSNKNFDELKYADVFKSIENILKK